MLLVCVREVGAGHLAQLRIMCRPAVVLWMISGLEACVNMHCAQKSEPASDQWHLGSSCQAVLYVSHRFTMYGGHLQLLEATACCKKTL